jgi:hypothetical protein
MRRGELACAHEDRTSADPPIENVLEPPTVLARTTAVSVLVAIFAIWARFSFVDEARFENGEWELHNIAVPTGLTVFYLISLPILRMFTNRYLSTNVDVKLLLRESMILYNAGQVLLNGWMVVRIADALLFRGHPFIGGPVYLVDTGATYAVWLHYCDKYLEFLDTYFMVLRGKMDQVSRKPWTTILLACFLKLSHVALFPWGPGFLSSHLSPRVDCVRLVVRTQAVSRWRHLFWSSGELIYSCHDVFLLHAKPVEDKLPVEEIPHNGTAYTVPFRSAVFGIQHDANARGRNLEAIRRTRYSGL